MTKPEKIKPPAELSPRVVPRGSPMESDITQRRRGAIQAGVIDWKSLVLATWQLDDAHEYAGELPAGMDRNRFSARVLTAAKRMGGRVGVAVRGRRWWVWGIAKPVVDEKL